MPIRLNVATRVGYMSTLADYLRTLEVAIRLEDTEAITHIRVEMCTLIRDMYCYTDDQKRYVINRFNDLVADTTWMILTDTEVEPVESRL